MTEIVTTQRQVYRHPAPTVYIADALRDQDFVEVPYLRCVWLQRTVAPAIDFAKLIYTYGNILREGAPGPGVTHYDPQDLVGKFVKVVCTDTVYQDAFALDPETDEVDQTITWFGIIEYDQRDIGGSTPGPANLPMGQQMLTAFGGLRLLEKEVVRSAIVDIDGTDVSQFTALGGLPFNLDPGGVYNQRGNRSADRVPDPDGSYIFNWEPRGRTEWTAFTAVEYLLAHHTPKKEDGSPANVWELDSHEDYLDWYEISEPTDGRTLKSLLDALIPRHRGVAYWVDFDITREDEEDPETAANKFVVHVFTFNKTDLTLPNSHILKANPNQFSLDFEHAFDIDEATVGNVSTQHYHEVIARGARRTTTFTTRIHSRGVYNSSAILGPSWTSDDETEYKDAASGATDYTSLTDGEKKARNSAYRQSDRLREVFRRFVLNMQVGELTRWDCQIPHPHSIDVETKWWLRGDQTIESTDNPNVVNEELDYSGRDYIPGLKILRSLPFYERKDYSGTNLADFSYSTSFSAETHPSFIPLLSYVRTHEGDGDIEDIADGEDPHRYEMLDRLHSKAFDEESNRKWSCRVNVVDTEPGVELIADVPHFIAGPTAGEAGYALTHDNQLSSMNGGLPYTDIFVTLQVELTEHVEHSEVIEEPPTNAPRNVFIISVPDARFDYVIPHTTVEIRDGLPIETTTGGAAKDDRQRLESIAKTAAQWYSTVRQTLDLRWRQIRATFELGDLITDVGGRYQLTDINTPITSIVYDFGQEHQPGATIAGATHIQTAFTTMDFQQ